MLAPAIALTALLVLADPPAPAPARCAGRLAGAVLGTFECGVTLRPGEEGQALFVIEARTIPPGLPGLSPGAFEIPQPVEARTYTLDTLGQGKASVAAAGGTLYTATKTFGQRGEVRIILSSVREGPAGDGGWVVHGSYRARLIPAGSGKAGEVVIDVDF